MKSFKIGLSIWSGILLGLVLPIDFMYSADAFLKYETVREYMAQYGIVFMFLLCVAVVISTASALVIGGLRRVGLLTALTDERVTSIHAIGAATCFGMFPMKLFRHWGMKIIQSLPMTRWIPLPWWVWWLFAFALGLSLVTYRVGVAVIARRTNFFAKGLVNLGLLSAGIAVIIFLIRPAADDKVEKAALPAATVAPITRQSRPNIFLITVDALSARHMGLYGYERDTTPNLAQFAQQSYVFERFYANSNFTTSSVASIFTGERPWNHRVFQGAGYLRSEKPPLTLASALRENGYFTASFVANQNAHPRHLNIAAGFAEISPILLDSLHYRVESTLLEADALIARSSKFVVIQIIQVILAHLDLLYGRIFRQQGHAWYSPALVFDPVISFLEGQRARSHQPLFVWAHVLPPHFPYVPETPFLYHYDERREMDSESAMTIEGSFDRPEDQPRVNALRLRYDEHVLYADHHIGRFLQYLQDRGWLDRSIVVISADHGESFEKGFVGHGGPFLYEPLIHVPLLIHLPGQKHQKSISTPAEQVDLLPTMLDLVGLDVSAEIEGESLVPLLNSKRNHGRVFSMNFERNSIFADITHGTIALIEGDMKYIHYLDQERFGDELFDLRGDLKESVNLITTLKEVSREMRSEIERKLSEINRKGGAGQAVKNLSRLLLANKATES